VAALTDTTSGGPLEIGNALHRLPETVYACATFYAEMSVEYVPDDPYFQYQYYFNNPGGMGSVEDADIDADSAWLVTLGDTDLEIAVLDVGIMPHEDLPASRITMGFDAIGPWYGNPKGDWDPSPGMDENHGMACAGIIAASHNALGIAGLVPNCKIRPVKIFDDDGISAGQTDKTAEAIDYAAHHGPVVLSNSWGFGKIRYPYPDIQQAIIRATSVQVNRDYSTVVVFSAGNVGEYINYIPFPKWMDEVICVGAIDREDDRWFYSCYGPELDVVAPSGDLRYGEYDFRGDVFTIDQAADSGWNPRFTLDRDTPNRTYTGLFGGTSAACPQVAGIAAMILSRRPEFICDTTHKIVRNVVIGSAIDLGTPGPDNYYGYGRANAYRALLSVIRGDVDNNGTIDPVDVVTLINCVYKNWCNPICTDFMED